MNPRLFFQSLREVFSEYLLGSPADEPPGVSGPLGNVPVHRTFGGEAEHIEGFARVHRALRDCVRPGARVALCGMPGVGKSWAAYHLASVLAGGASPVRCFYVDAHDAERLRLGIARLGRIVPVAGNALRRAGEIGEVTDLAIAAVLDELAATSDWLLILDGMDGCFHADGSATHAYEAIRRRFLTSSLRGRIVMTTSDRPPHVRGHGIEVVELEPLSDTDAAAFFLASAQLPRDDVTRRAARAVARQCGRLPIELAWAAVRFDEKRRSNPLLSLNDFIDQQSRAAQAEPTLLDRFETLFAVLATSDDPSRRDAADLLRLCAFFGTEPLPSELLASAPSSDRVAAGESSTYDLDKSAKAAWELRLLDIAPNDGALSVPRAVQTVLRELMTRDGDAERWRRRALDRLEAALADPRRVPLVHPHVRALVDGGAGTIDHRRIAEHVETLDVLAALRDGDRWETIIFGGRAPSYEMLGVCLEDPAERGRTMRRLAAISMVCSGDRARLVFTCIYMLLHYWWDNYLHDDLIASPLLDLWADTHTTPDDVALLATLRRIESHYPAVREYRERTDPAAWEEVRSAIEELREMVGVASIESGVSTAAARFARGITNIYLAESWRFTRDGNHPEAIALHEEAIALFGRNGDSFHHDWAIWELADRRVEIGIEVDQAVASCRSLVVDVLQRAEDDELDTELVGRCYSTLGNALWRDRSDVGAVAALRWAAAVLAYAFIRSEEDRYGVELYAEQVDRAVDWCIEAHGESDGTIIEMCQAMRKGWGWRSRSPRALERILAAGDTARLAEALFPPVPELTENASRDLPASDRDAIDEHLRLLPRRIDRAPTSFKVPETLDASLEYVRRQLESVELVTRELLSTEDPAWEAWKRIYESSFPIEERMSDTYFEGVLGGAPLRNDSRKYVVVAAPPGRPSDVHGIVHYEVSNTLDVAFLWYMATRADLRGGGRGAAIYEETIRRARVEGARALIFEVEIPRDGDAGLAARRIAWYRRLGARQLRGIRYLQCVDRGAAPVEMHLMAHLLAPMSARDVFDVAAAAFGPSVEKVGDVELT